ncbi:MAG: F0F1 ATP synthase subunit delta, partial [bacterium]
MKLRSRASGRYARALHDLALAESMLEPVAADMVSLQAILAESAEVRGFISDYQIPTGQRSGILVALFSNRLHPLVWQFVRFLESRRRLGLLAEVAADFREQEEARQGLVRG